MEGNGDGGGWFIRRFIGCVFRWLFIVLISGYRFISRFSRGSSRREIIRLFFFCKGGKLKEEKMYWIGIKFDNIGNGMSKEVLKNSNLENVLVKFDCICICILVDVLLINVKI